jgi:hypothetical protein
VHNLSHPTLSLNHNWSNAHNLAAIYRSLSLEAERCRDAIADVKEMLIEQARSDSTEGEEAGWRREWEETVNRLIEQSEGWRCAGFSFYFWYGSDLLTQLGTIAQLAHVLAHDPLCALETRAAAFGPRRARVDFPLAARSARGLPPDRVCLTAGEFAGEGVGLVRSLKGRKRAHWSGCRRRSDRSWSSSGSDRNKNGGGCRVWTRCLPPWNEN